MKDFSSCARLLSEDYYIESGKASLVLQCMVLISAGNEHEFFPFSFLNIFLLRSVLQADFKLMKVRLQLCFIGLGLEAIEIPLPLLLRKTCFFLPSSGELLQSPSLCPAVSSDPQLDTQGSASEGGVLCQH